MKENPFDRINSIKDTLGSINIKSQDISSKCSKEELVLFKSNYYSLIERTQDRLKELIDLNDRISHLENGLTDLKNKINNL